MCVSDIPQVYVELPTNSDGLPEKTSFLWSLLSSISALALQRSLPFGKAESESFEEGNMTLQILLACIKLSHLMY